MLSRLEHWRKVDYAIEAFTQLGVLLRVIGTGIEEGRFRARVRPNTGFLGVVEDKMLAGDYSQAKAVVFT
jgi:hypothetical protein